MRKYGLLSVLLFVATALFSQPRLVVGIVVDQMRYDYLDRFQKKFGPDGFRRLQKEGFSFGNMNYNYVPTFTGPGHASIYTGTTPAVNGIVSNAWYERLEKKTIYCAADPSVKTVGSESAAGAMSPKRLFSSTMTDALRDEYPSSKIIGIALKDRGAILPAGKNPTAAYWYDGSNGHWVSGTYYMKELPKWVTDFNSKERAAELLKQKWTTLLPIAQYTESGPDNSDGEEPFEGMTSTSFPYDLPALMAKNNSFGLIKSTPFGNTLTAEFAKAAIAAEGMGKDSVPDFLALSFSSTDYIGHQFGPQSVEVEDCYLRLDRDIADLLKFLDEQVGKKNYLVFLTADHGGGDAIACNLKKGVNAGNVQEGVLTDSLKRYLMRTYKDSLVLAVTDFNVYLKRDIMERKKLNPEEVQKAAAVYLKTLEGIADAVTVTEIERKSFEGDSVRLKVKAGFNRQRSGDVVYVLKPNWLLDFPKGCSHGTPYRYDTHVPLIFFGWKVRKGSSEEAVVIPEIAPTICSMLDISNPNGTTGIPLKGPIK